MKVAILGSRGIPNRYGGFEELAERLATGLADKGHDVTVYNTHNHPAKGWKYPGVRLVKVFNPEIFLGSFGQFLYDLGAVIHCWFHPPDIILQLGYTSSSIWMRFFPKRSRVITNMDGLEWRRSKYSKAVQRFLRFAERLAARQSHLLIADHPVIEHYLQEKYPNQVIYIPYGADIPHRFHEEVMAAYKLKKNQYDLLIARMEPENHIIEVIEGFIASGDERQLLVVGGTKNGYGRMLRKKFRSYSRVRFLGSVYDKDILNVLRNHARYYFHGHSVGGTNPSLLEAMACKSLVVAHDNTFNRGVLNENALYFSSASDISHLLKTTLPAPEKASMIRKNLSAIRDQYNWQLIVDQYELAMKQLLI